MKNERPIENKKNPFKGTVVFFIVFILFLITINAVSFSTAKNEYSVVRQFGKVVKIIDEPGLNFKVPFIQDVSKISKAYLLYDVPVSDVITKDKKTMVADSFVLWRITDPLKFIKTLNGQVATAESRINTIVYNSMKNVISSLSQAEVISGRDGELTKAIMDNIGTNFEQYGILLTSVETKALDLPTANKTAVFERMISERNNIAAQFTAEGESEAKKIKNETNKDISVQISEAESQAEKIIAEGEAEYMRIISNAYSDKSRAEFYEYVRALDALSASMKGDNKTVILDSDSPIAKIFNSVE